MNKDLQSPLPLCTMERHSNEPEKSQEGHFGCTDNTAQPPPHSSHKNAGIHFGYQICLNAVFFGAQLSIDFVSIYAILILQYFGLPLYLVSFGGLINGVLSLTLVPLLGAFSDRGLTPKLRKAKLQALALGILLAAYAMIAICAVMSARQVGDDEDDGISPNTTVAPLYNVNDQANTRHEMSTGSNVSNLYVDPPNLLFYTTHVSKNGNRNVSSHNSSSTSLPTSDDSDSVSVSGVIGLLAIAGIELAYDISSAVSKGLAVECVPAHQKTRILNTSTLLCALGGCTIACVGMVDFTDFLGDAFNTDGFAATLILLSVGCSLIISLTYGTTIRTAIVLNRKNKVIKAKDANETPLIMVNEMTDLSLNERNVSTLSEKIYSEPGSDQQVYEKPTEERCNSFDLSRSNNLDKNEFVVTYFSPSRSLHDNNSYSKLDNNTTITSGKSTLSTGETTDGTLQLSNGATTDGTQQLSNGATFDGTQQLSNGATTDSTQQLSNVEAKMCLGYPLNRHFILSIISAFLSFGCIVCGCLYASNTLTLEVYKGDPSALPGSLDRQRYEEGLRMSSFGFLASGVTFALSSIANRKLMDKMNHVVLFMLTSAMVAVSNILFYLLQSVATFMFMMISMGVFRSIVHVLSYLLALKYFTYGKIKSPSSDKNQSKSSSHAGRVASLVTATVPLHYLLFACMGPAMKAAGNSWTPILYVTGIAGLNCFVMLLLLVV